MKMVQIWSFSLLLKKSGNNPAPSFQTLFRSVRGIFSKVA